MPARLPDELRHRVIVLWISGYTIEIISREVEASVGSVRNIVQELRERRYPEFKNYVAILDDMRRLFQQLRASKHTLQEALTGLAVYEGLTDLDLDPSGLLEQIQLFQRVIPPDFPADQFARSALRVTKMESETGLTYDQLETRTIQLKSEIAQNESRKKELTNSINSLRATEEDAKQSLGRRLTQNKLTEQGLQTFLVERDMLSKVGLGPDNLRPVADLVSKCGTADVLTAARELSALESKTGMNVADLVTDYKRIVKLREQSVSEHTEARAGILKSQVELRELEQVRTDQLARNQLTDGQLGSFLATRQQLATWGIGVDRLEPLRKVFNEIERQGFQPKNIVEYLQAIVGLQEQKRQLESQVANIQNELNSKKKELQGTNSDIVARTAELGRLKTAEAQTTESLSQLQLQAIRAHERVELVETFLKLLHDPATIANDHIAMLIASLQQILKARGSFQGFPIDYDSLRKQFKPLLEKALDDTLLPRERLDIEMRKLDRQHAILGSQKKEFEIERSRIDQMSQAKLLKAAAAQNRKGVVFVGVCGNCRSTVAVRRGAASNFLYSYHCPCCWVGTLDSRPLSSP